MVILILMVAIVIIGPMISSYNYKIPNKLEKNLPISAAHWFGTDTVGRDLFVRVCEGGRVSLLIGVIVTFINLAIGGLYGSMCGYYKGLLDDIVMRIVEILMSIPSLFIIVLISLMIGDGPVTLIIALSVTGWCNIARLIRGQLIQLKEQEFVLAAQALGANSSRIISKHLLANLTGITIIIISLEVPSVILMESILSFIGFGISEPNISWGLLCEQNYYNFAIFPYQLIIPSLFISITTISMNLLGDRLTGVITKG